MNCDEKLVSEMPLQYLPNDPSGRHKIIRKRTAGEVLKFSEKDLSAFVTGGHKRKEERRRKARNEIENKKLEEKRMKRREKEATKKTELRRIRALTESNVYLKKSVEELRKLQKERSGDASQQQTEEREFATENGVSVKAVIKSL